MAESPSGWSNLIELTVNSPGQGTSRSILYASLSVDAATNELICVCYGIPTQAMVTFQLVRHSSPVGDPVVTTSSSHRWDVGVLGREGGNYHVDVTVELEDRASTLTTEWQFIPSDRIREVYREWLTDGSPSVSPVNLKLRPANRPYETVAVVQFLGTSGTASGTFDLNKICAETNARVIPLGGQASGSPHIDQVDPSAVESSGTYVVTSAEPVVTDSGSEAYGSGFAFHDGVLRRGSDVMLALTPTPLGSRDAVVSAPRYSSLRGGNFVAAVVRDDHHIEFHTDYFGAAPWYEYQSDGLRVVASSYYLAARIARACGESLSMNLVTIDGDFTSLTQGFQQPLVDELPLKGFVCLRPDIVVVMNTAGDRWAHQSQHGHDLMYPERFTVDRYNELIEDATAELVTNCEAVLSDQDIREVRCDISGGLDSRLVLAAFLAGSKDDASKLTMYTSGSSPTVGDEKIAVVISEVTGVKFSESPTVSIGPCTARHRASRHIVDEFGTYWHSTHSPLKEWDPSTAYVSGSAMDNLARDYSTPTWKITAAPATEPRSVSLHLAKQLFRWRGRASIKPAPSVGLEPIARAWDEFPGDELDKGSQVFNFYRARFHGGGAIPAANGVWRVAPGPSRPFHLLRLMSGRVMSGPGTQIKMIHKLNPELAAVPYAKAVNNEAHAALYGSVRTDLVGNPEQLIRSRKVKRNALRWKPCPECVDVGENSDAADSLTDLTLSALRDLARDPELNELMLPPFRFAHLYFPSEYGEKHSFGKTFANKVLHLHGMWRLTQSS